MASSPLDHDEASALCSRAYAGLPVGSGPCHTLEGSESHSNSNEMVYGEMTLDGMGVLHDALQLQPQDVVYDLGSGVGKFVLYTALRGICASCTGVEVGLKRHATAERACSRLEEILQSQSRKESSRFSAVLGDIRQPLYRDATIICLCNIMFGGALNASVLANVLAKCPSCSTVASIVQLHHPRLQKRKVIKVGCTWASKGVSWTLYSVLPPMRSLVRSVRHDLRLRPSTVVQWQRPMPQGATGGVAEWMWKARPGTSAGADMAVRLRSRVRANTLPTDRPCTSAFPSRGHARQTLPLERTWTCAAPA